MKRIFVLLALVSAVGMVVGMIGCQGSTAEQEPAQEPIARTMLLKPDVTGIEGKEALVLEVEFAPGAVGGEHFHPGTTRLGARARTWRTTTTCRADCTSCFSTTTSSTRAPTSSATT